MFGGSSKVKRARSFNVRSSNRNEELPLPESSHLTRRITILSPSESINSNKQRSPKSQRQSPKNIQTRINNTQKNNLERRKSISLDDVILQRTLIERLKNSWRTRSALENCIGGASNTGMQESSSDPEIQNELGGRKVEFERVLWELQKKQRIQKRGPREYASVERINEEKGQTNMNQIQPFPVDVELRHQLNEPIRRQPTYRSQTMQIYSPINFETSPPEIIKDIDIKGVTKVVYDGIIRKITKNQILKITNTHMCIKNEKGVEDVILADRLNQTTFKQSSKKEIIITNTLEDSCKIYKLQFDSAKDTNIALLDLGRSGIMSNSEEKSQIKHKLLKLLGKRSSKDLLERKGIIKNEPIFGNTLKHLYEACKQPVPEFVIRIVQLIELPKNIQSVGLYRASGNLATIQKIRFHIDKNNLKILEEFKNDIDVLTGSLKLFFRELKEPLIPHKTYEELCRYIDTEINTVKTMEAVKQLVNRMEISHRKTLLTLLEHLIKVESHNEENRMDAYNISIVWGPTLIWPPDNCHENILLSHTNANKVIELLINVYKRSAATVVDVPPSLKNESSPKLSYFNINKNNNEENQHEEGNHEDDNDDAASVQLLNRNALMLELNENLSHGLKRSISKDNLMRSNDSLTKTKDELPRTPDKADIKHDLEFLCANTREKIPEFVLKVVPLIEQAIRTEYIYRKNGSNEKLDKIKKKIAKNKSNLNSMDKYNVHDLTSALKNFFLDLRQPLIPKEVFNQLVLAAEERIEVTKLRNVRRELNNSHIPYKETLDYLFRHLVNVSKHEESNKMSKHNIAIEWTPILCHHYIMNNEISIGCCIQVVDTLLQIYDTQTDAEDVTKRINNSDIIQEVQLGRSPDKFEMSGTSPSQLSLLQAKVLMDNPNTLAGLPPVSKRKPKLTKNDSSLYRVSKFIAKPLSFYDNVHGTCAEDIKNEAVILETSASSMSAKKGLEDRTKL